MTARRVAEEIVERILGDTPAGRSRPGMEEHITAALLAAEARGMERAAQIAEDEKVELVGDGDEIYNRAIDDAVKAIRAATGEERDE